MDQQSFPEPPPKPELVDYVDRVGLPSYRGHCVSLLIIAMSVSVGVWVGLCCDEAESQASAPPVPARSYRYGMLCPPMFPATRDVYALRERLDAELVPTEVFWTDAARPVLGEAFDASIETWPHRIVGIPYRLPSGLKRTAYAYELAGEGGEGEGVAVVIVGSGWSYATTAVMGRPTRAKERYDRMLAHARASGRRVYVLIKAMHGPLAIHDGKRALHEVYSAGDLLARGGSYGAAYLSDAHALLAHGRRVAPGEPISLLGHSQGARAALLVSMMTSAPPDRLVLSHGWIRMNDWYQPSSLGQIHTPGFARVLNGEAIRAWARQVSTRVVMTLGATDLQVVEDRKRSLTRDWFAGVPNVSVQYHEGGHEWVDPVDEQQE